VQALIAAGYADGTSHRAFGRVPLAVACKQGQAGEIRREMQIIKALLAGAESIAYTGAGTSGRTYLDVLERLEIGTTAIPKSLAMGGGAPVASVATGETELAVAPLTTGLATPGVAPAAIFPVELGAHIDMSAFLCATPQTVAADVLAFLTAGALDVELAAAGLMRFDLE
jgi:hypothetical protein